MRRAGLTRWGPRISLEKRIVVNHLSPTCTGNLKAHGNAREGNAAVTSPRTGGPCTHNKNHHSRRPMNACKRIMRAKRREGETRTACPSEVSRLCCGSPGSPESEQPGGGEGRTEEFRS